MSDENARPSDPPAMPNAPSVDGMAGAITHIAREAMDKGAATRKGTAWKNYARTASRPGAEVLRAPKAARLRDALRRALLAEDHSDNLRGERRGRFDTRAAARFERGALNVKRRRIEEPGETSAVLVLLDASGSMSDSDGGPHTRSQRAAALGMAVAQAVEQTGAPVEIWAFGHPKGLTAIKLHNQRTNADAVLRDLAAFLEQPYGQTPLLQSLMYSAARIAKFGARADRRTIVSLADGDDGAIGATPNGDAAYHAAMRHAYRRADCDGLAIKLGRSAQGNAPWLPADLGPTIESPTGGIAQAVADTLKALEAHTRRGGRAA